MEKTKAADQGMGAACCAYRTGSPNPCAEARAKCKVVLCFFATTGMDVYVKNLREAGRHIMREISGTSASIIPYSFIFTVVSVVAGIVGFLTAIFRFDRGFKEAVLYGTHCFLYVPAGIAGTVLLVSIYVAFHYIREGLYNQLANRWAASYRQKHPDLSSFPVPHYRFLLTAVLVAVACALVPALLIVLTVEVVSAFVPYGLPNIFGSSTD